MQNLLNNIVSLNEFISFAALFLIIPLMILGCSASSECLSEKMDAPLQQRIHQLEKEDPDAILQFTGKTNTPINDEMKTKFKSIGITTESIIGDLFTASGNVESIKKASLLDFVVYMEIAKKLDINK